MLARRSRALAAVLAAGAAACLALAGAASAAASASASAAVLPGAGDWTNERINRVIDLGGTITRSSTKFTIRKNESAIAAAPGSTVPYYISLSSDEDVQLAWTKVTLAVEGKTNEPVIIDLERASRPNSTHHIYAVQLPKSVLALAKETVALTFDATFSHMSSPLPKTIQQSDPLYLLWQGEVGLRSPYATEGGRVLVRSQFPRILSFSPKGDDVGTKSGSTVTFGPYSNIPPLPLAEKSIEAIMPGKVHYQYDQPVISAVEIDRHVEVSHWGNNLATEDRIWLRNDGASLKGFFSRVDHQKATYQAKITSHILQVITLHLPPGAKDVFFIDKVGNVSTSHLNAAPDAPQLVSAPAMALMQGKTSRLALQPRYPLLGGWNYSFSVGWNMNLGEGGWGRHVPNQGLRKVANDLEGAEGGKDRFVVGVMFVTPITDVATGTVRTKIVLPEGAVVTKIDTPFEMDSIREEKFTSYLDTIGRPAVVLEKTRVSEQHGQLVYIHYTLSSSAHYRKPLAIAAIVFAFFGVISTLRRFDGKISA
ncbi:dolichyl-diphosphooligosaccharide--protein glycosyltransferase subunit 1 [Tilletia horrida]|nr:dolichyl-diphosphooligosaccharide--protein glycosyltransferase subunit 1 [Tilletia horrida]